MTCQKIPASFLLLCCITLWGCPGLVPGTQSYKGFSSAEEQYFKQASKEIYPNDVRNNLEKYQSSKIAWPGVITEVRTTDQSGTAELTFVIEHHYYNWLLDYSIQSEKIFLSPRGEGVFRTTC